MATSTSNEPSSRAKALKRAQDDLQKQHQTVLIEERNQLLDKLGQNRTDMAHIGYTFTTKLEQENHNLSMQNNELETKNKELTAEVARLKKKR